MTKSVKAMASRSARLQEGEGESEGNREGLSRDEVLTIVREELEDTRALFREELEGTRTSLGNLERIMRALLDKEATLEK